MKSLICDCHEPQSIQQRLKAKFSGLQVGELGLSSGDFFAVLQNGIFIAERKTPDDFITSIADSRVFEQSQVIPTLARFPVLVLDGEFIWSRNGKMMVTRPGVGLIESNWKRESIEMAKLRIQANGMLFVECNGLDYAERVARLLTWCETEADCGHAYRKTRLTINPFEDEHEQRAIDFISMLPGIGYKTASEIVAPRKAERLIDIFLHLVNQSRSGRKTRDLLEMQANEVLKVETLQNAQTAQPD